MRPAPAAPETGMRRGLGDVSHHAWAFSGCAGRTHPGRTASALRTGLLCLVLLVLMGCAEPNKPNLEVACALTKCTCLSNAAGYFARNFGEQTTTEVLWTDTGNAYCPEDFFLRQVEEKKKNQYYTP